VTQFKLVSDPRADLDIEAAFEWYEKEQAGLGIEFLDELRAAYASIVNGPFQYEQLRSNIRRALLKRFPYAVFFSVEDEVVVVLAVLHTARDPAEWQRRGRQS
jgi:plasmid stabilization system protein ParE